MTPLDCGQAVEAADKERAERYHAADEWPDPWPTQRAEAVARLAEEFAAVRLAERRSVALWIILHLGMFDLANAIERGEARS